jgi:hypothetical protein
VEVIASYHTNMKYGKLAFRYSSELLINESATNEDIDITFTPHDIVIENDEYMVVEHDALFTEVPSRLADLADHLVYVFKQKDVTHTHYSTYPDTETS